MSFGEGGRAHCVNCSWFPVGSFLSRVLSDQRVGSRHVPTISAKRKIPSKNVQLTATEATPGTTGLWLMSLEAATPRKARVIPRFFPILLLFSHLFVWIHDLYSFHSSTLTLLLIYPPLALTLWSHSLSLWLLGMGHGPLLWNAAATHFPRFPLVLSNAMARIDQFLVRETPWLNVWYKGYLFIY